MVEKKGDIFNQFAIISDLIENVNLTSVSGSVVFVLDKKNFDDIYSQIIRKIKVRSELDGNSFVVKIGKIDFVFNMSNA